MRRIINIRILTTFALVVLFFGGGLFLDYTASQRWITLSGDAESNKAVVEFAKKEGDNLSASAKVLYDFAKIALGVLVTLLAGPVPAGRPSEEGTDEPASAAAEKE